MTSRYVPPPPERLRHGEADPEDGAEIAGALRLTRRDRWLLRLLWDHRVLTTHQIAQVAFGSYSRARHRLAALNSLDVVDRFRPKLARGSAPWHYHIGLLGARILAAEQGTTVGELGYRRDRQEHLPFSSQLVHMVGTNGLFTALVAASRHIPDAELIDWWPEHRCAAMWRAWVRPDAYGHWRHGRRQLHFFVEYDTGSETIRRVAAKLTGYAALAADSGITTPLLIWTTTPAREANLATHLQTAGVPVATSSPPAVTGEHREWGPAGPVWRPVHRPASPRIPLTDLGDSSRPPQRQTPS